MIDDAKIAAIEEPLKRENNKLRKHMEKARQENGQFRNLLGHMTTCADCAGSRVRAEQLLDRRRDLLAAKKIP